MVQLHECVFLFGQMRWRDCAVCHKCLIQMDAEQSDLNQSELKSTTEKVERSVCSSSEARVAKSHTRKKLHSTTTTDMSGEEMHVSSTVASEGASDDLAEGECDSDDSNSDPGTPLQDERDGDAKSSVSHDEPGAEAVGVRKNSGQDDHGELDYNEESNDGELPSDSEQPPQRLSSGKRSKSHKVEICMEA